MTAFHPDAPAGAGLLDRLAGLAGRALPDTVLALVARAAAAGIFWTSGRTKVEGLLSVKDSTFLLFAQEYRVPLLPPDIAAYLATYAEHLFPVLLVLGLLTRVSALALLVMTLVIQLFVYPSAWPTHLAWAAVLLFLAARGGGGLALDRAAGIP